MRFLAVDDDPAFLEIVRDFLEKDGRHEVQTANSAMEALHLAESGSLSVDAFLLDIQMPGMNGVELCAALRGIDAFQQSPILMVTRVSDRHFIDDAFGAGATDYINKPFDPLEWKSRINMVERLHNERQRVMALALQAGSNHPELGGPIDFEAPIFFPGQDNGLEFLALENYILTLDRRGMFSHAAIGIHVENALQIHQRANPMVFIETMGDVAASIYEGLKAHHCVFAYAGRGDFVVLTPRQATIDVEQLEFEINHGLSEFEIVYAADGLPTPRVRVGEQVRGSIFGARRPTAILQQAIEKGRSPLRQDTSGEARILQLRKMLA